MKTPWCVGRKRAYRALAIAGLAAGLAVVSGCDEGPPVRPRAHLSASAFEDASQRLEGTWHATLSAGDAHSRWAIRFEGRSVTIDVDGQEQSPRGWQPTLVETQNIVIIIAHKEHLSESVLRFVTPDSFYLEALPDVLFERAH